MDITPTRFSRSLKIFQTKIMEEFYYEGRNYQFGQNQN